LLPFSFFLLYWSLGVVVILILTRVEEIGIKVGSAPAPAVAFAPSSQETRTLTNCPACPLFRSSQPYLRRLEPYFQIVFGTYGDFRLSASVVFQLDNILTYPNLNWKYELFYTPFILPFVFVSLITFFVYRHDLRSTPRQVTSVVLRRLANPAVALLGALVLVQLMIKVQESSPAYILGTVLAKWFQQGFVVVSPLLGALGSFFSGSTTVSNLTFGTIQLIAAEAVNTSVTAMLALQSVGASAGNGICLNNIISAIAVVGLKNVSEGKILMQTYKFVLLNTTIATVVMLAAFFRFG